MGGRWYRVIVAMGAALTGCGGIAGSVCGDAGQHDGSEDAMGDAAEDAPDPFALFPPADADAPEDAADVRIHPITR